MFGSRGRGGEGIEGAGMDSVRTSSADPSDCRSDALRADTRMQYQSTGLKE